MATGTPTAAFLHLSDLHLGESVTDTGTSDRGKLTAAAFRKYGGLKMQAHDPYIFAALATEIRLAARFVEAPRDSFDVYLVTGDLSTSASSDERFTFAKQFLCNEVEMPRNYSTGLKLARRQLFCIPGNHDKLSETNPQRYLSAFRDLPAAPPYKKTIQIKRSSQQFIFYAVDSNFYDEANLAIGKIYPETMSWLAEEFSRTKETIHPKTVRILLLHHHPADLNPYRKKSLGTFLNSLVYGHLTELQEGERLLDLCAGNIDLILHGHEHFPVVFKNERGKCIIVSAGTASQFHRGSKEQNSFHTLAFRGRKIVINQFDWNGARFRPIRYWEGDLDAGNLDGPNFY